MPLVDHVEHGLANQVGADRVQPQIVAFEQIAAAGAITAIGQGLLDVEMIPPAGQFEPLVAELAGLSARSSSGRSAHWPVNNVTGRAMHVPPALPGGAAERTVVAVGCGGLLNVGR